MKPTQTPAWAVGMRKLCIGLYVDADGNLHVSREELCEALGLPFTEANAKSAERLALDVIRENWPDIKVSEAADVERTVD